MTLTYEHKDAKTIHDEFENMINKKELTKVIQNLESFNAVKLNLAEFDSEEPKNKKVESRSRIQNWLIQAGYFGSAMLRKKS